MANLPCGFPVPFNGVCPPSPAADTPKGPDCWHVHYGDVHVGTIVRSIGNRNARLDSAKVRGVGARREVAVAEAEHHNATGEVFDSHRLERTLIHVPHITATVDNEVRH